MKTVTYVITDEMGLHARPAGLLVKQIMKFSGKAEISSPKKTVDAKRIMAVMSLGLKQGDTLTITLEGEREEEVAAEIADFLKENL